MFTLEVGWWWVSISLAAISLFFVVRMAVQFGSGVHLAVMLEDIDKQIIVDRRKTRRLLAEALPDRKSLHVVTFSLDRETEQLNVRLDGKEMEDADGTLIATKIQAIWLRDDERLDDIFPDDEAKDAEEPLLRKMTFAARMQRP
jgi:hypothetical protein